MKLRRQLILVSLLTLILPWAGCQYAREMKGTLREGQSRALLATAQAVANRIANEPLLVAELTQSFANVTTESQLYAHPLAVPMLLDGYDDDWRYWQFSGRHWQHENYRLHVQVAHHDRQVFLFVEVNDPELVYYHPGQTRFADSDHLILRSLDRDGRIRDFAIVASAPGLISAYDINTPHHEWVLRMHSDDDVDEQSAPRRQEHGITGYWQERAGGYQVELQLPWYLTQGYLGVAMVSGNKAGAAQWLGSIGPKGPPAPLVKHSDSLRETLAVFASDDLRLRLATNNQWLVAEAGQLDTGRSQRGEQTWLAGFLRTLFMRSDFPQIDNPRLDGRLDTDEVSQALGGQKTAQWYRQREHTLARAAAPIRVNQRVVGAVVAEQTSASLLALTDSAFRRLVLYTLLATGVAGLGLVAYASWLSLRIRRLSRAADTAIRDTAELTDAFVPSTATDEIGDLSRSYNQLLTRVQEYTGYLRTLSNKLSHELRTPLAVVRSSLDNLDNEGLNDQAKIYSTRAHEGAQRLSAILNAISSASRVEESIRQAEMAHFPLDKVVRELALAYQDIATQKVVCKIAPSSDYALFGSADLVVQMIDKFFDNACDFCPPDGTISLSLARTKTTMTLTIGNDGPPLPEKMQSQLFDSLVSVRDNNSENNKDKIHLGLGLHIVRLIADLHQARVSARNRNRQGVEAEKDPRSVQKERQGVEFEVVFPVL